MAMTVTGGGRDCLHPSRGCSSFLVLGVLVLLVLAFGFLVLRLRLRSLLSRRRRTVLGLSRRA